MSDAKGEDQARAEVQQYWNTHPISTDSVPFEKGSAESFEAIYERWERDLDERRASFAREIAGKRLLEVGCGIGIDGRYLSENGVVYQAVDFSRESLKLARKHFGMKSLPQRFVNGDGRTLPFADETFDVFFSSGVLHHIPAMERACAEAVRVLKPGGRARVMLYHRHSYHYLLVHYIVRPLIWTLLKLPFGIGGTIARGLPSKFRDTYEICERHGFSADTILYASTDTSTAGDANWNPLSYFVTRADVRRMFAGLDDFEFHTTDLKYFPIPIPAVRRFVEGRWGFFLQIDARKPE